ncbi:hypothetical protein OG21DRAFT_371376 [Imleria badia]|nr:hypothetical protein OG21DRAFT_371376 [Imleria badia]
MEIFTLYCWVRGQGAGRILEAKISKTETIAALKEAIKDKNPTTFRDVDAMTLSLYKHRGPVDKESVSEIVLSEHAERLMELDELSEVFPEPPPKHHIHIIVDTPYPTIFYWFRGAEISQEGSFRIHSNEQSRHSNSSSRSVTPSFAMCPPLAQGRTGFWRIISRSISARWMRASSSTGDKWYLIVSWISLFSKRIVSLSKYPTPTVSHCQRA